MNYSDEQKKVIESDSKTPFMIVLASPGSGKTFTMIQRYVYRKRQSIFLTFTKNTQIDIAKKIENQEIVYTIDSFCFYLCNKFKLLNKHYMQMYNPGDYKVIVFLNKHKIEKSFFTDIQDLYIDEIQDICFYQYQLILFMKSCNPEMQIYMTGDTKQNIFVFRNTTNLYLYSHKKYFPNSELYFLQTNYRIQNKHLLEIITKIEKLMINPFDLFTEIPDNVPLLQPTIQQEIQCVKHKSKYAAKIYEIVQLHKNKSICILCRNNKLLNQTETDYLLEYKYSGNVLFSNIHCAKGMEYDIVIFIGVEKDIIPSIYSDNITEEINLFFTAISRPRLYLYMLYHDTISIFLETNCEQVKKQLQKCHESLHIKFNEKNEKYIQYNEEIQKFQKYYTKNPHALNVTIFCPEFLEKSIWHNFNGFYYAKYLKLISSKFPEHFTHLFKNITYLKKIPVKYSNIIHQTKKNYPNQLTTNDFVVLSTYLIYKKSKKIKPFLEVLHLLHLGNTDIPEIEFDFSKLDLPEDILFNETNFSDFENETSSYKCLWDINQTNIQHIAYSAKKNITNCYHIIDLINMKLFSIQ